MGLNSDTYSHRTRSFSQRYLLVRQREFHSVQYQQGVWDAELGAGGWIH